MISGREAGFAMASAQSGAAIGNAAGQPAASDGGQIIIIIIIIIIIVVMSVYIYVYILTYIYIYIYYDNNNNSQKICRALVSLVPHFFGASGLKQHRRNE